MDYLISSEDSNEYINIISHLVGAVLSLVALFVLVVFASVEGKPVHFVCFLVYGVTTFLSFAASTVLHFSLLRKRYSRVLGIVDHCAIFLLIAGTYTPLCLVVVKGTFGWTMFGIVWGMALLNIVLKAIFFAKFSKPLSMAPFLIMGWLAVVFIHQIYLLLGIMPILLVAAGGAFYTIGSFIFYTGKPNPCPPLFGNHEIWHVSVILGNLAMFLVMLLYVLPYPC